MEELRKHVATLIERAAGGTANDALLLTEAASKAASAIAQLQEISIKEQSRYRNGKGC